MADPDVTEADLADLTRDMAEAAGAYIQGDGRRYFELIRHADDYTLMSPYGGEVQRGSPVTPEHLEALARFFRGGEAKLDVVQTIASGNLAVLVAIERQHGEVGGLPDQDWSLRVTLVFRHEETGWQLVHRHADPLVHPINHEQLAALARG